MMKPLSFKVTSNHLLLCIFLSPLWGVTSFNTTSTLSTNLATTTATNAGDTRAAGKQFTTSMTLKTTKPSSTSAERAVKVTDVPVTTLTTTIACPNNVENVTVLTQTETTITLKWEKVDNTSTYYLRYNDSDTTQEEAVAISGPSIQFIQHTVTSLTAMRKYSFTLISANRGCNSSGYHFTNATAPPDVSNFTSVGQNMTSITLQWEKVENTDYRLTFGGEKICVTANTGTVTYIVTGLTNGTQYNFTLFTVFENVRSNGTSHLAATAPRNAEGFKAVEQDETSITLQWEKVNDIVDYKVNLNSKDINCTNGVTVTAKDPLIHCRVSGLTNGTQYNFTLFTVFYNVKSSGVEHTAVTAPRNAEGFKAVEQDETSITLQWEKVNDIVDYKVHLNRKDINCTDEVIDPLIRCRVTGLTNGTQYNFTLFTVFYNVESSGVEHTAVTAPRNAEVFKAVEQDETSITLQWEKVNDIVDYKVHLNSKDINCTNGVTVTAKDPLIHCRVSGLTNGTQYNFTLFTVFYNVESSGVEHTAATAPRNAEVFKSVEQDETSITLQWEKVENTDYRLTFGGKKIDVPANTDTSVTHKVSGLTSGTQYNFTLFTVLYNVSSSGTTYLAATVPENVNNVNVMTQNESSVTLEWHIVKNNTIYSYILRHANNNITINGGISESQQNTLVTYVVSPLAPGIKYIFTLFTKFEGLNSSGYTFDADTVPPNVSNVIVTNRSLTSLTLSWENVNKNWSYLLDINGKNMTVGSVKFSDNVSVSVKDLKPGTLLPFRVITTFFKLNSEPYEGSTLTTIDCTAVSWHRTNSSIQGMVEGAFTDATAIYNQIHVSPSGKNVSFTGLFPGATYEVVLKYNKDVQCCHNLTILPPDLTGDCKNADAGYSIHIVWTAPQGVLTQVEANVTGQNHASATDKSFIISGFLPARTYQVSLGAMSGKERSSIPYVFQCSTDARGVIAGSTFAVLLFIVLICLVAFILLRKPDLLRKKAFIGGAKLSNTKSKPVSVAKFPDHFYQLSVDDNRGFSEEYETLAPVGTEQTRKFAILPENKVRNRFNNVLPYDWSRVKLNTGTSDYINANYMPGYNSAREYIATQGPLPATLCDFWMMIWEQRVRGIVMVTNCVEGGRTKCEQYWPSDNNPCPQGDLLITMRSEQQETNWTLREFSVKHTQTSEERTVKQFHFTAWPDHGVPQCTRVLIDFRALVRWHIENEGRGAPTVVHCSAGVGRTGTLIALDVMLQQLDKKREVGINAFVHKMRQARPYMVQTESQYIFLHQCIMDSLQTDKTEENIYENSDMIYVNATALQQFR